MTKFDRFRFEARLKLTPNNIGFLGVAIALVVLGAAPAFALARTFL